MSGGAQIGSSDGAMDGDNSAKIIWKNPPPFPFDRSYFRTMGNFFRFFSFSFFCFFISAGEIISPIEIKLAGMVRCND